MPTSTPSNGHFIIIKGFWCFWKSTSDFNTVVSLIDCSLTISIVLKDGSTVMNVKNCPLKTRRVLDSGFWKEIPTENHTGFVKDIQGGSSDDESEDENEVSDDMSELSINTNDLVNEYLQERVDINNGNLSISVIKK